jgi:DNA-binding response OmpR family regulator
MGNALEVQPKQERILQVTFPLIIDGGSTIVYFPQWRSFLRDNKIDGPVLSKTRHIIFAELLRHPDEFRTSEALYKILYPDSKEDIKATINDNIWVTVSRIRDRVQEVHPALESIIVNVRGQGYIYKPHPSLRQNQA